MYLRPITRATRDCAAFVAFKRLTSTAVPASRALSTPPPKLSETVFEKYPKAFTAVAVALLSAGITSAFNWWMWNKEQVAIPENAVSANNALSKAAFEKLVDKIADSIMDKTTVDNPLLIARPQAEQVTEFLGSDQFQTLVVCGERGVGKSWLVEIALQGEPAVVVIETVLRRSIEEAFLGKMDVLSGSRLPNDDRETFELLAEVFKAVTKKINSTQETVSKNKHEKLALPHKLPTLVFEIESRADSRFVQDAASFSKRFAADKSLFHSILVLSDANAAFKLPEDPGRSQILYLGDLSESEAGEFIDKSELKDSMSPELRKKLFESVGTRVLPLKNFVKGYQHVKDPLLKNMSAYVDDYIKKMRAQAMTELIRLLKYRDPNAVEQLRAGQQFQQLARMLLTDQYKNGVHEDVTSDFMAKAGIACESLKGDQHAISYHLPTKTFRFNTPAHRWAAEQWAEGHSQYRWYNIWRF